MMTGAASGSSTRNSRWRAVMPTPSAASITAGSTPAQPGDAVPQDRQHRIERQRQQRRQEAERRKPRPSAPGQRRERQQQRIEQREQRQAGIVWISPRAASTGQRSRGARRPATASGRRRRRRARARRAQHHMPAEIVRAAARRPRRAAGSCHARWRSGSSAASRSAWRPRRRPSERRPPDRRGRQSARAGVASATQRAVAHHDDPVGEQHAPPARRG